MNVVFRPARLADYFEIRRITREAYLHAGHFTAHHPYLSVLDNVEHRAEHAEVWVAEASGAVVAAVTLTFAGQPYSEIAIEHELEFRMLAVDPAVQGGGVGRAVVRQIYEAIENVSAQRLHVLGSEETEVPCFAFSDALLSLAGVFDPTPPELGHFR